MRDSYLASFSEELVFTLLFALCALLEQSIIDLGDINATDVNLGAGGDGVGLVDSLEGNTVDLVGAGNKEKA